jgi:hypothetical protein
MTNALSDELQTALGGLDNAIAGITGELGTLVEQVQLLDNGGVQADLVNEIQNRALTLQTALQSAQTALSSTAAGTPTAPDATVGTGTETDLSTAPSTGVDGTDTAMGEGGTTAVSPPGDASADTSAPAPGSSMG